MPGRRSGSTLGLRDSEFFYVGRTQGGRTPLGIPCGGGRVVGVFYLRFPWWLYPYPDTTVRIPFCVHFNRGPDSTPVDEKDRY